MAAVWNPRRVLGVDPDGSFTCVGTTQKGARCRNSFFSNSDLRMASNLLNQMAASDPRDARGHLRPLAEVTLCPRWHRKPGYSQVESMKRKWWNIIVSNYVELQPITSTISNPVSLPRNTTRASRSTESTSASRSLLTPPPSPPSPITAPRLPRNNTRHTLASTESTSASLSLATPPPSPPSPILAPRSLPGDMRQALHSNDSNLASLSLLTPPTSLPSPTPAPRLLRRNNGEALGSTVSTLASLSFSTPPTSPPSPTPAPRLLQRNIRESPDSDESLSANLNLPELPPLPLPPPMPSQRNIRQSSDSDESLSASISLPELPPLPLPASMPLLETIQTSGSTESRSASLSLSTPPQTPSPAPRQLPLPALPADVRRATSIADPAAIIPLRAPQDSPQRYTASPDGSTLSTASSAVTVVPRVTSPPSPRQAPALDYNNNTSTPVPASMPTAIASSLQTPPSTPRIPRRQPSNTWQQLTLESPMQPSPSPCSHSSRRNPLNDACPSCEQERSCLDDPVSCLATCGTNMLNDCSTLWRKMCLGRKAFTAYICCSPWQYELHD